MEAASPPAAVERKRREALEIAAAKAAAAAHLARDAAPKKRGRPGKVAEAAEG